MIVDDGDRGEALVVVLVLMVPVALPEAGGVGGGLGRLLRVQGLLLRGSDVRMLLVDRFL